MDVARYALESHVSRDLFDINKAGLGLQLEFGFLRNGQLEIRLRFRGLRGVVEDVCGYVNAVAGLLHVDADFVRCASTADDDFGVFP